MEKNIIFVKNFITFCLIGVYPEEKKNTKKKEIVDIEIDRMYTIHIYIYMRNNE